MPTPKETARSVMLNAWQEREKCVLMCRSSSRKDKATIEAFADKDEAYRDAVAAFKAIE